ncbi:MAG TPA: PQQ-dependent sugar dehydrogenase, partial [Draconibacterium sp.]|nr:PQQ-dependent sugar dehydrogenase [Draconibacterium sp.]
MKILINHYKTLFSVAIFTFFSMSACTQPNGATLYQQYCATCHGADLKGGNSGSLVDGVWQFGAADSYKFRNVKFGITHLGMPSYGAALKDDEIKAILQYVSDSEKKIGAVKPAIVKEFETLDYKLNVEVFAEGLEIPWAIDFLDATTALITEKPGRLRVVTKGKLQSEPVKNIPKVLNEGQGGLMDIAVDPNYKENGWIYLAFSHVLDKKAGEDRPGAMTKIVRGKIENNTWTNEEVLFEAPHEMYRTTRHHYGCRIVFDPLGHLYFSIGERGLGFEAQDIKLPNGKVHRINKDGSIPVDNPFVNEAKAIKSIYSFGNRNIQGIAVHPETGEVWATEHGPMGGDELNLIKAGKNYGWPEISYGINYDGKIITEFTHKPGMEQPNLYWRPSIAVCGLDFYTGDLFTKWKNKLLVGALKYEEVRLLDIENDRVMHDEVILKGQGRVRDVQTGPDGA